MRNIHSKTYRDNTKNIKEIEGELDGLINAKIPYIIDKGRIKKALIKEYYLTALFLLTRGIQIADEDVPAAKRFIDIMLENIEDDAKMIFPIGNIITLLLKQPKIYTILSTEIMRGLLTKNSLYKICIYLMDIGVCNPVIEESIKDGGLLLGLADTLYMQGRKNKVMEYIKKGWFNIYLTSDDDYASRSKVYSPGDADPSYPETYSMLHLACRYNHIEAVKALIESLDLSKPKGFNRLVKLLNMGVAEYISDVSNTAIELAAAASPELLQYIYELYRTIKFQFITPFEHYHKHRLIISALSRDSSFSFNFILGKGIIEVEDIEPYLMECFPIVESSMRFILANSTEKAVKKYCVRRILIDSKEAVFSDILDNLTNEEILTIIGAKKDQDAPDDLYFIGFNNLYYYLKLKDKLGQYADCIKLEPQSDNFKIQELIQNGVPELIKLGIMPALDEMTIEPESIALRKLFIMASLSQPAMRDYIVKKFGIGEVVDILQVPGLSELLQFYRINGEAPDYYLWKITLFFLESNITIKTLLATYMYDRPIAQPIICKVRAITSCLKPVFEEYLEGDSNEGQRTKLQELVKFAIYCYEIDDYRSAMGKWFTNLSFTPLPEIPRPNFKFEVFWDNIPTKSQEIISEWFEEVATIQYLASCAFGKALKYTEGNITYVESNKTVQAKVDKAIVNASFYNLPLEVMYMIWEFCSFPTQRAWIEVSCLSYTSINEMHGKPLEASIKIISDLKKEIDTLSALQEVQKRFSASI